MANTWTLYCSGVSFAAGKVMCGVMNGGARVLRARRVGLLNTQTASVTGVVCQLDLIRYRSVATWAAPTAVAPIAHDTTNSALVTVSAGYAGTPGGTGPDYFRRTIWSSDEPALSSATSDEWECLVPLNVIWDAGYTDANVQPLVVRTNESVLLYNNSGAAGLLDSWIEFTDEAS